jgi:hypothetical protein
MFASESTFEETVRIDTDSGSIYGKLATPEQPWGAILIARGGGATRFASSRDLYLVDYLNGLGLKTLEVDLLSPIESRIDAFTARHRFDIGLLTERITIATEWLENHDVLSGFRLGYFAGGTEVAAALKAAALQRNVAAVVSWGGRPDLAGVSLRRVRAATLLMVGELEQQLVGANRAAYEQLTLAFRRELSVIAGATHVLDAAGAYEEAVHLVGQWFVRYLGAAANRHEDSARSWEQMIKMA